VLGQPAAPSTSRGSVFLFPSPKPKAGDKRQAAPCSPRRHRGRRWSSRVPPRTPPPSPAPAPAVSPPTASPPPTAGAATSFSSSTPPVRSPSAPAPPVPLRICALNAVLFARAPRCRRQWPHGQSVEAAAPTPPHPPRRPVQRKPAVRSFQIARWLFPLRDS
jgi:hypothetical protein